MGGQKLKAADAANVYMSVLYEFYRHDEEMNKNAWQYARVCE